MRRPRRPLDRRARDAVFSLSRAMRARAMCAGADEDADAADVDARAMGPRFASEARRRVMMRSRPRRGRFGVGRAQSGAYVLLY